MPSHHAARFRVAFGHMPLDRDDPGLREAGVRSLGILKRELRALLGGRSVEEGDRTFDAAVAFCWSAVHGYVRLLIDGHLDAVDPTYRHDDYLGDIADRAVALAARASWSVRRPPVLPGPSGGSDSTAGRVRSGIARQAPCHSR